MQPLVGVLSDGMIDQADPRQRRRKAWEVVAPPGWRFSGGEHALICFSRKEAASYTERDLEPCPRDCPCEPDAVEDD